MLCIFKHKWVISTYSKMRFCLRCGKVQVKIGGEWKDARKRGDE